MTSKALLALVALLTLATPAHAVLITQLEDESIFLGQVGNSTDPSKPFNLYLRIRREAVYDLTDGISTLVFSRVIRPEEYLGLIAPPPFALTALGFVAAAQGSAPPLEATPEPATLLLLGTSLAVVGWVARKRRR